MRVFGFDSQPVESSGTGDFFFFFLDKEVSHNFIITCYLETVTNSFSRRKNLKV